MDGMFKNAPINLGHNCHAFLISSKFGDFFLGILYLKEFKERRLGQDGLVHYVHCSGNNVFVHY